MDNILMRLSKQKPKKIIIMSYNLIRISILKIFYNKSFNSSMIQNIHPSTEICINKGKLELKNSIFTRRNVTFRAESGNLKIGTSFFNQGCCITAMKNIVIGNDCLFGPNVVIVDHDHNYSYLDNKRGNNYLMGEIIIGNNVWVGANTTILRGSIIEDGAVIGAGSVIKGFIKKNTVVCSKKENITKIIKKKY
jgi:acetyltransferase-like isoleucine patch superfamily enzyme